jgi:arsenite-transporting ATPase
MFITIGNFKREMILPVVLAKRRAAGGALRDGMLEIDFLPLETGEAAVAETEPAARSESAETEKTRS